MLAHVCACLEMNVLCITERNQNNEKKNIRIRILLFSSLRGDSFVAINSNLLEILHSKQAIVADSSIHHVTCFCSIVCLVVLIVVAMS